MLFLIYFTVLFFPVIFYLIFYFNNKKNSLYSMSLLNRVPLGASVVYMLTRQRINVPKACQFVFTCQRPNKHGNLPTFQSRINFSTWRANVSKEVPIFQLRLPKGIPIFQLFFKAIFQFLNFLVMLNIFIANFGQF